MVYRIPKLDLGSQNLRELFGRFMIGRGHLSDTCCAARGLLQGLLLKLGNVGGRRVGFTLRQEQINADELRYEDMSSGSVTRSNLVCQAFTFLPVRFTHTFRPLEPSHSSHHVCLQHSLWGAASHAIQPILPPPADTANRL